MLYVATAMVKPAEIRAVLARNGFHIGRMAYTAAMVVLRDFLTGVMTAIVLWGLLARFLERPAPAAAEVLGAF